MAKQVGQTKIAKKTCPKKSPSPTKQKKQKDAKQIGQTMWPNKLAKQFGQQFWPKHLAKSFGQNIWPKNLALFLT